MIICTICGKPAPQEIEEILSNFLDMMLEDDQVYVTCRKCRLIKENKLAHNIHYSEARV
jgi:hypothetical protein